MTIQPSKLTVNPGKSSAFLVVVTPLNSFSAAVQLEALGLPDGLTASFSPKSVSPPGQSVLTVTASSSIAAASYSFNVCGTGGGVTVTTTTGPITVNFGLIPTGYGTVKGQVTDAETGQPISGATVQRSLSGYSTSTGTDGSYSLTMPINEDVPLSIAMQASDGNVKHYQLNLGVYLVRDTTVELNFQLVPKKKGIISGTVTDEQGNLIDRAQVWYSTGWYDYALTDTNGFFSTDRVTLGNNNSPVSQSLRAEKDGFWSASQTVTVQAGTNPPVHLIIMPVCKVSISGTLVYADNSGPVTNGAALYLTDSQQKFRSVNADPTGYFDFEGVPVGVNNKATTYQIQVPVRGNVSAIANVGVNGCGQPVTNVIIQFPRLYNATLVGRILDAETSQPLTNSSVSISTGNQSLGYADADEFGNYAITNMDLGTRTNMVVRAQANADGASYGDYYPTTTNLTLVAGPVQTNDLRLLRKRFGYFTGTIRDAVTHLPIANATAESSPVDVEGRYLVGPYPLNFPNLPTKEFLRFNAAGYWGQQYADAMAEPDTTNKVDAELVPICQGATIVGTVVNALTQKPIARATVYGGDRSTQTDSSGSFVLTNLTVGAGNTPAGISVTATASGFNSQSRTVMIFCGATVVLDFGQAQTVFGSIEGYVTNVVTGEALTNAFVGGEFGSVTNTDNNGHYLFTQVPLGANAADRNWKITVMPSDFAAQTKSILVTSNAPARLDFGFSHDITDLAVTISASPNPVNLHTNLTYTITLVNQGGDAANVKLTSVLPPGVTLISSAITNVTGTAFSKPTLEQGAVTGTNALFPAGAAARMTVVVHPTIAGALTNIARVTTETPDSVPDNNTALVVSSAIVNDVDLGITALAESNPAVVSNLFFYAITVTNAGPGDASGVIVSAYPPASVTVSDAQYDVVDGAVLIRLGSIKAGASASQTLAVVPGMPGTLTFKTTATCDQPDPNPDNNTATVVSTAVASEAAVADLGIVATGTPNPVTVGDWLTYQVTVTNRGPVQATDVIVTNFVPANVQVEPGDIEYHDGMVLFRIPQLELGTSATRTFRVAPQAPGTLSLQVTVGGGQVDPNTQDNTVTVSTVVNAVAPADADLGISMAASPDPVTIGSPLTYVLTLTNRGPTAATGISITNILPTGVDFASATGERSHATDIVIQQLDALAVGSGTNLTLTVIPRSPGVITNQATVLGAQRDPNPADNTVSVATTVSAPSPQQVDLSVAVSATPATATVGNALTYLLVVTNRGPAAAVDVRVTNTLPAGVEFISATGDRSPQNGALIFELDGLGPGLETNWTVVVRPMSPGTLTNEATVSSAQADAQPADNSTSITTVVQPVVVGTSLLAEAVSPLTLNRQTGLFEQRVRVTNGTSNNVPAVRLLIVTPGTNMLAYNSSGQTPEAKSYVLLNQALASGQSSECLLEYYVSDRRPGVELAYQAESTTPVETPGAAGNQLALDRDPVLAQGRLLVEFASSPGSRYVIEYSSDLVNWKAAAPPIRAAGNRVQWLDDGPPKTESPPAELGTRLYRVVLLPGS